MHRKKVRYGKMFLGKSRAEMIKSFKALGFTDVCDCEFRLVYSEHPNKDTKIRKNSGEVGLWECSICKELMYPWDSIYECDECMEPTLANLNPLPIKVNFYCDFCD